MWSRSFWPDGYWAPTYWAKVGGEGATPPAGGRTQHLPIMGVGSWLIGALLGNSLLTALLQR